MPPDKGRAEFYIPQGQGLSLEEKGKGAKPALLSPKAEREALENWNPGLKPEERQKELKQKENDRAQIKEFAKVTNNAEKTVKTFLNVVKESDLEAGRTLNDVHGNLVRVDQRMLRPAPDEIQFFNLVKRPAYAYNHDASASGGFKYNGAASVTNRLDLMQMTMRFNQELPQRIEEWPGFFSGNDVKADYATFLMANRTNREDIFFVGEGYKYDAVRDELVSNPAVVGIPTTLNDPTDSNVLLSGRLTGAGAVAQLNAISRLNIRSIGGISASEGKMDYTLDGGATWSPFNTGLTDARWAIHVAQTPGKTNSYEITGDPALWQYRADLYNVGNDGVNYIWYARENYAIDNSGSIQQVDDFVSSNLDPFTILKNVAGESIMYVKKAVGVGVGAMPATNAAAYASIDNTDYYAGVSNIDLVIIPDLALAAVQKMLPAITELNK
ncbi:MAG TPA: hypothetical protein DCZ93_07520 [Elusimicrobia bacterium]|nr:hypothetical protein [Elusimicrobiota bacterium]